MVPSTDNLGTVLRNLTVRTLRVAGIGAVLAGAAYTLTQPEPRKAQDDATHYVTASCVGRGFAGQVSDTNGDGEPEFEVCVGGKQYMMLSQKRDDGVVVYATR